MWVQGSRGLGRTDSCASAWYGPIVPSVSAPFIPYALQYFLYLFIFVAELKIWVTYLYLQLFGVFRTSRTSPDPTVWSQERIYIIAGMKKFFVFLFLLRIWHFGDGALFLFFNLIFYFPHHRLLPTPFTHSLVFASVPLSHIHHLNKFHPNLISWNIVCDRQNNEWAKQMNGCRDWHFLHHFDENPSRQNARFGVFFL